MSSRPLVLLPAPRLPRFPPPPPAAARHFALPTAWKSHAGLLTLLAAIAIWGCNWPVMKAGLNHVTPIWFSALRFATGELCLFAIRLPAAPSSCPPRRDWRCWPASACCR
jgi:hypothetical protein